MIEIKPGVSIRGVRNETTWAFVIAASVYQKHGLGLTVTSVTEGVHGHASLHYPGFAMDLRTHSIPDLALRKQIAKEIDDALGDEFDVIHKEHPPHIHIEFQPKGPIKS